MNKYFSALRQHIFSRSTGQFIGCLVIILVVAGAFFYPDAFEGNSLNQHDMQQGLANGQEAATYHAETGEVTRWTNSLFSGMPTFQISPSYPSMQLFGWVNTVMGLGLPSPANLLAMMMVGFLILMWVMKMRWPVAVTGAIAYGLSSYFIIIIGAGHIWKFLTLVYVPPTIAGIILCYRGRYLAGSAMAAFFAMMQIAQNHVQMTYYFLFVIVGVVIAFLVTAIRRKKMRSWSIATVWLAFAAVLAVAANMPSLYNTYEYSKETMRGNHSLLSSDGAGDSSSATGLDKNYITQYSYQPSETFTLLIPDIKGGASARPEKGRMVPTSLSELDGADDVDSGAQQYIQYLSQYFGDPEGTNGPVYIGALIFAFFLLGAVIVRGPLKWILVILTVFSIVLAWGRHAMVFTDIMLAAVPMYGKFRTVESILVIAEFTMPLLAAMGLQKIFTATPEERGRYMKPALWCFGIPAVICIVAALAPGAFGSLISDNDRMIDGYITEALISQGYPRQAVMNEFSLDSPAIYQAVVELRGSLVTSDAIRSLFILIFGGALLLLYLREKISWVIAACGTALIVLGDLYIVNKRYLSHDSFVPAPATSGSPIVATAADNMILADTAMNYRVMDIPRFTSAAPSYYHKAIGGYHAAKLTRYQDLIDRHLSHFLNGTETDADWNVLNMLNARYVVGHDGEPLLNPEAQGNAWIVDRVRYVDNPDDEMAALSAIDLRREAVADRLFGDILGSASASVPGDTIFETSYAPNRLTFHASLKSPAVAVFSEVYFPWGWKATVNGQPAEIARVNYVLRAISLPAGQSTVVMTFDPESIHTTDTLATVAIVLIYLGLILAIVVTIGRPVKPETEE